MDLRYPIGHAVIPDEIEPSHITAWIRDMAEAPTLLEHAVADVSEQQLDTPYRPGGWTVRQVVHHLPDSHMNAYLNFRLGLTEENPTIRPVDVDKWVNLADCKTSGIDSSLTLFRGLQERFVTLLETMRFEDFHRTLQTARGDRSLATFLGIYAWHGKHHVAQINSVLQTTPHS